MDFGVTPKKMAELETRMAALGLREQDLQEKFIHSSGPGGQRVNKTASCVYLKHVPTGLAVKMLANACASCSRKRPSAPGAPPP